MEVAAGSSRARTLRSQPSVRFDHVGAGGVLRVRSALRLRRGRTGTARSRARARRGPGSRSSDRTPNRGRSAPASAGFHHLGEFGMADCGIGEVVSRRPWPGCPGYLAASAASTSAARRQARRSARVRRTVHIARVDLAEVAMTQWNDPRVRTGVRPCPGDPDCSSAVEEERDIGADGDRALRRIELFHFHQAGRSDQCRAVCHLLLQCRR